MSIRSIYLLVLSVLVFSVSPKVLAQNAILPTNGYFVAPDAENVLQVWRLSTDGNAEMLTHAQSKILGFTVSPDEQQIAYSSGGQLWLQKSNAEAEVIAQTAEEYFLTPAFSPEGTYVAYTDGGVRIVDLASGLSEQVLTDEPLNDQFGSILRYYVVQYLDNDTLYIQYFDYGPYDAVPYPGLFDLKTGRLAVESEPQPYAGQSMTLLKDGQLLFTAYSRIGKGMPGLVLVDGDIAAPQTLLADEPRLKEDPESDIIMPILDAVEAQLGQIRFIGERILPAFGYELFDYDLATGDLIVDANILEPTSSWSFHQLSPDGKLIAGLANYDWQTGQGGDLTIINLATGTQLDLNVPGNIYNFQWHITPT